ncbi:MAG: sensor histidine kinase [Bacteroidales bacterium]|nr:MAG: sensor histidine kinase [Bacteroidales bacterium]
MFTQDKEILLTFIASTFLMVFLVIIIIVAIVRYQNRLRKHSQEISKLNVQYQEEIVKVQIENEEQTLNRISQEIHDNIGQILSLVKLNLNTVKIEKCDPQVQKKIVGTKELVSKAITDLRQLSKSLNSIHLSEQYLSDSIKQEIEIINRTEEYTTDLVLRGDERAFDPQKQLIIFRIVQEILNNIVKHAKARQIRVELDYGLESFTIKVIDDGVGFDLSSMNLINGKERGTGLSNISYRAQLIGASLGIDSQKGKGTTITLNAPC